MLEDVKLGQEGADAKFEAGVDVDEVVEPVVAEIIAEEVAGERDASDDEVPDTDVGSVVAWVDMGARDIDELVPTEDELASGGLCL